MINYSRDQMLFDDSLHYSWDDQSEGTSTEILDRLNGRQVLDFINRFATEQQISSLTELQEVEFLIRYGTPSTISASTEISDMIKSKLESQKMLAI
jgi:ABC-type phosphate/phosphonate transport system ATPase subunit